MKPQISALEFHAGMKRHFPALGNAGRFLDPLAIMSGKRVALDILAFDDWLHEKHGEYETTAGQSMRECIAANYSPEAAAFVESLI